MSLIRRGENDGYLSHPDERDEDDDRKEETKEETKTRRKMSFRRRKRTGDLAEKERRL